MSFYLLDLIWHEQKNVFLQNWDEAEADWARKEGVKTQRIRRPDKISSRLTDYIFISSQGWMMTR